MTENQVTLIVIVLIGPKPPQQAPLQQQLLNNLSGHLEYFDLDLINPPPICNNNSPMSGAAFAGNMSIGRPGRMITKNCKDQIFAT